MTTATDEFMRRAIALSLEGVRAGHGGPFGAVVARDGRVLGEGNNRVLVDADPTAHAEVVAIRRACAETGDFRLTGATLYTSCEPCPMCLAAAYWSRVDGIVYAATRDDAAAVGFDDAFFYAELPLPPERRSLTMRQALRDSALPVMKVWQDLEGKTPY